MIGSVVRAIHGNSRSPEGYLLLKRNYVLRDQERTLGWGYIGGLIGGVIFLGAMAYLAAKFGVTTYRRPGIPWVRLSPDARIASIILFPALVIGLLSALRLILVGQAILMQRRSDLD
ncbi:hypothetical protein [Sphingomonas asaccharolytica]|uniref:hypothetical protein n=1 Tax=Sphingomonas asaccharolytica TaxID=40681 RepID=UPI00082D9E39|nr:hypothetical protein [Sphingomonas asaccharolytica]